MARAQTNMVKRINEWIIHNLQEAQGVTNGVTTSRQQSRGTYHLYEVGGPGDAYLLLAYAVWENGECDVRPVDAKGPQAFMRLANGGLRLSIDPLTQGVHVRPGRVVSTLRQARIKPDSPRRWSNLCNATLAQINEAAGVDVASELGKLGAVAVGTKADVLGSTDSNRAQVCVVYEHDNRWLPLAAFVLTRGAPLLNEYGMLT